MKTFAAIVLVSSFAATITFADVMNFDDLKPGTLPPGWTATQTGKGHAKWEVVTDESAPSKPNVLKQAGEATYPVHNNNRRRKNIPPTQFCISRFRVSRNVTQLLFRPRATFVYLIQGSRIQPQPL